jgi:hypothetical protein
LRDDLEGTSTTGFDEEFRFSVRVGIVRGIPKFVVKI